MIYFDHNATTPVDERVIEAMQPYLAQFYGNPSALYKLGRISRSAIDRSREQLAGLLQVLPSQIIFTSGGTEANNLAFKIAANYKSLAVSAIEHPSVMEPALALQKRGHHIDIIGVNKNGVVERTAIAGIPPAVRFVSIMLANNETGAIQNVAEYAIQLRARNVVIHTDAVQALGKIPFSFAETGAHLMSVSSHKIYGPKGCGALVVDKGVFVEPLLYGGGQEQGYRSGTENVAAIVGFGKAAEIIGDELTQRINHFKRLRCVLERELLAAIPQVTIFGENAERLPNTVQFGIEGVDGEMLLMKLDRQNIAVSSGSACASGGREPGPVLTAMGFDAREALTAVRVSLGKGNTESEVMSFVLALKKILDVAGF